MKKQGSTTASRENQTSRHTKPQGTMKPCQTATAPTAKKIVSKRPPPKKTNSKRAAGFLGGWTAGEGLRRPLPLREERASTSGGGGGDESRGGSDDDDDGEAGAGRRGKKDGKVESAEERWMRERDDWLFGRYIRKVLRLFTFDVRAKCHSSSCTEDLPTHPVPSCGLGKFAPEWSTVGRRQPRARSQRN